jgi:hypothetical protein
MTILRYPRDQFIESVIECLDIAEVSINLWKPDGSGIFGYPAALLLLCVIDAMGHNFPKPEREKLGIDFLWGCWLFRVPDSTSLVTKFETFTIGIGISSRTLV